MTHKPSKKRTRHLALWLGLGCFALGIFDIWLLLSFGLEFSISGRDGTLLIGVFVAVSFGIFGSLWGFALTARKRERHLGREKGEALLRLAEAQSRVAQMEKMSALGQMVASIAHEVRNPLAIIRSGVQNLSEADSDGQQPTPEEYEIIIGEIDRLTRVVEALNHFARPLQPNPETITTGEIAGRLRFMTRALYQDRQTPALTVSAPSTQSAFTGDPDLLCQALLGLVINAVEANPPDQSVDLAITDTTDRVVFEITDHGPGIPENLRQKVFEPFFTTKTNGNGLGLAIAAQIAEALGGTLIIKDGSGGGARLCLSLPRTPPEHSQKAQMAIAGGVS